VWQRSQAALADAWVLAATVNGTLDHLRAALNTLPSTADDVRGAQQLLEAPAVVDAVSFLVQAGAVRRR